VKARVWSLATVLAVCALLGAESASNSQDKPQYTKSDELIRPANYRDWVYLSSGLGMSYSSQGADHPMFTNVFVPQWAYREFLASGKWPEQTMFVVEERASSSTGSINKAGHFQAELMGLGVEVKDEKHFPDKWAYFNFDEGGNVARANPKAACWQCHEDHAAVEHTFVQFYPTLKAVAQKFGSYRQR
jgi:cytochrome P460